MSGPEEVIGLVTTRALEQLRDSPDLINLAAVTDERPRSKTTWFETAALRAIIAKHEPGIDSTDRSRPHRIYPRR